MAVLGFGGYENFFLCFVLFCVVGTILERDLPQRHLHVWPGATPALVLIAGAGPVPIVWARGHPQHLVFRDQPTGLPFLVTIQLASERGAE